VVDGIPCVVNAALSTEEKLICETGSKASPSILGPQPGQPGITYTFVNPEDGSTPTWANSLGNTYPKETKLWTSLETLYNTGLDSAMHNMDGWFRAPETGKYRFYMQADD
jgi:hypothetical protein